MEERNILWGEVVGGLLIVGCSVALVISLWQTLQQIPYFPFIILATITAALFGAGLYTLERWKLQSTSRGLMMIASLLVPLDLLVMAGLHRDLGGRLDWLEVGVLAAFLSLFVYLLRRAGRVLLPEQAWLYPAGVLGPSVFQVAVPMLGTEPAIGASMLLGTAAAVWHGGTAARIIHRTARQPELQEGNAQRLFGFLGVSTFALGSMLGLLIYAGQAAPAMLQALAPLVALGGVPLLAGGALVHRRLEEAPAFTGTRTAGTGIALTGALIQLAAIPLAWPDPLYLGLVCLLNFVVLTDAAFRWRLPVAHVAGLPSLALGYLTACHFLFGGSTSLAAWMTSASAGSALVPLVAALAFVSEWLMRREQRADGACFAIAAGTLALVSLLLVSNCGIAEPYQAAAVYLIYAAAILACNQRWHRVALGYIGLGLVPAGTLWLLHGLAPGQPELWAAVLAGEALILSLLATPVQLPHLKPALRDVAAASGGLAAAFLFTHLHPGLSWSTAGLALLAGTALALAWSYRQVGLTTLGSLLILAAWMNGLGWNTASGWMAASLVTALVGQAALSWLIARGVQRIIGDEASEVLIQPLDRATLLATFLAVPFLVMAKRDEMLQFMMLSSSLAALWLAMSLQRRWAWLFACFQAALAVSALFGVTAWLVTEPWLVYPAGLLDPRSLQAYGIALAGLSLFWVVARPWFHRRSLIQDLLEPAWPAFDRVALALLVVLQIALVVWAVIPAVAAERSLTHLTADWPASAANAFGPHAWILVGIVSIVLTVRMRQRIETLPLVGLVLQVVTAAVLAGGAAGVMRASASALAWALAGCFLAGSILLWLRQPLARSIESLHIPIEGEFSRIIRQLLIGCCVIPVVVLCLTRLLVPRPAGPLEGTFFREIGPFLRLGVPLVAISLTLVGHALRERSAGFAFSAGLVAQLALVGGYAIHLLRIQPFIDVAGDVQMLQLGTAGAAVWAILWLGSRRWLSVWTEAEPGDTLMAWQHTMAGLGNIILLLGAVIGLVAWYPGLAGPLWTITAGLPLGWLALGLAMLALLWHGRLKDQEVHFALVAGFGLELVALIASTAAALAGPEWGYRALLMGAAFFALAWSLRAVPKVVPDDREAEAAFCVGLGYVLAVLLGLKAAIVHQDHLWAAGAIGLSACVGALMAVWQRREGWAFAAGLGLNLATSLVVWHQHLGTSVFDWWHFLLQANCIASGLVALIWLAARERFVGTGLVAPRPYLAGQIALASLGNLPVVGIAFLSLFVMPELPATTGRQLAGVGQLGGWLAMLLPMAAAFWHATQSMPQRRLSTLVTHGIGLGILAGCLAATWDTGDWLSFHAMTAGCLLIAAALAALVLVKKDDDLHPLAFEGWQIERGVFQVSLLVVVLALRGMLGDPGVPFWSVGAVLGVAALAVWLGCWTRQPRQVAASVPWITLAGNLYWLDSLSHNMESFIAINALCLALAAVLWSAFGLMTDRKIPPLDWAEIKVPVAELAQHLSLLLMIVLVASALTADLNRQEIFQTGLLTWAALMAVALAQILAWCEGRATVGLYAAGLITVGLFFHDLGLQGDELAWSIGLALANFVLATSLVERLERLIEGRQDAPDWFLSMQGISGFVAAALGLWMACHFAGFGERLAGALALALLMTSSVILSDQRQANSASLFRQAAIFLAGLVGVGIGWSLLGQPATLPWLHRNIVLMTAMVLAAGLVAFLQAKLAEPWQQSARRMAAAFTVLAALALVVVIAQEAFSYNRAIDPKRTELAIWAVVAGGLACLFLTAVALRSALVPERDPLRLSESWRTSYVYLAELGLLFLFIHLRLTAPWLFSKWLAPYWMFLVMAVAFAGVGLSEWFARKGLKVLAEPLARTGLFLPLVPLLAFWINEPAAVLRPLAVQVLPGSEPVLHYLELTAREWHKYSLVWFLTGTLFGIVALSRRSFRLTLVAALAANFGLWSLWRHVDVSFLVHPQFFLVPLAIIILVAEYVNRDRLPAKQGQSLRYAALGVLYLASSADMFIAGLDQVGWPLFLMLLCVIGVLAGMLFEVRAYLFLGTGFLFLVIFSMIWHAAVDQHQPWVWWASGIVLGAAILALFAVFEKRRNDVVQLIERIKAWN